MVSGLTCKSLIHFKFIFVYGLRLWSSFIFFAYGCSVNPTPFIEETVLSLLYVLYSLVINCPYVHGFISGLSILFH